MVRFFMMLAEHYNTAGQFKDALQFSQKIETLLDAQNLDQESHFRLSAQDKIHVALAGMDDWAQLIKRLDVAEVARQKAGRVDKQVALRGWAYLKVQRYAEAVKLLDAELQSNVASFGEAHFYTALTRGLLAQALSMSGQKDPARAAFDKASLNLTAPESLSGDFAENAIQRKMKRFILQSYMQLLSTTAANNAQDAQILFSVADQISTSTVQQALTEASRKSYELSDALYRGGSQSFLEALDWLTRLYISQNRPTEALAAVEQVARHSPKNYLRQHVLATLSTIDNQKQQAVQVHQRLLTKQDCMYLPSSALVMRMNMSSGRWSASQGPAVVSAAYLLILQERGGQGMH